MIRRIIEVVLLILLAIGGYQAWSTGQERTRLQAEFDRLVQATGDLPIGDPSKLHIRAIPTGEPLHFAWRIHVPANYPLVYQDSAGMGGGSPRAMTSAYDMIARVRIHEVDGVLQAFKNLTGAGSSNLGESTLASLIRGRESKILVEQFASQRLETIDLGGTAELIRLTLPPDLQAEGQKSLDPYERSTKIPVLYTFRLGKTKPKPEPAPTLPGN